MKRQMGPSHVFVMCPKCRHVGPGPITIQYNTSVLQSNFTKDADIEFYFFYFSCPHETAPEDYFLVRLRDRETLQKLLKFETVGCREFCRISAV